MAFVAFVAALAVVEYMALMILTGRARGTYGVQAPATTGHPIFERHYRVQQNSVEQLVIFLPSLLLSAHFFSARLAGLLGLVFIVGRALYARGYVADPAQRGTGFAVSFAANALLTLTALLSTLWAAL
jgi:uncharacterized membrane protein YecN with MAPEG domain